MGGGGGRGPRLGVEVGTIGGVDVAEVGDGVGTAVGMTASAAAPSLGEGGVGVVVSASATLGITVTNSRPPNPPTSPSVTDGPHTPMGHPFLVPSVVPHAGQVNPSSHFRPLTPSVGTFSIGSRTAGVTPGAFISQVARETIASLPVI